MTTQEANVRRYISTSRKMTNERILSFSIDLNLRGEKSEEIQTNTKWFCTNRQSLN
jgi:hypothetical protein